MRRAVILLPVMMVAIIATLLLASSLTRAVQNASVSLDMIPDSTYVSGVDGDSDGFPDAGTNHMTLGTIDNCLTTAAPGAFATHNHIVHLVIQNVEDLVGWQVRLNYIGDKMRPSGFNAVPFMDTLTGGALGFATLPLDDTTLVHRDLSP